MSVDLHAVTEGQADGPAVVFGGSLGSDLRMWGPQVEPLVRQGFRVIRYDHRGHGGSPVPAGPYELADLGGDLIALLDSLAIERAHVVGLSLGGMAAMWAGIHAPERVASLVLCCTSAKLGPAQLWIDRAKAVRESGTGSIAEMLVSRWLTPAFASANPGRMAFLRDMITATPDDGYAACCGAIERMDLLPRLPEIAAPTLVIAGSEDASTPPGHGGLIAGAVPGARLEIVEGVAHLGSFQRPDVFTDLILEHLKGAS
ncbi:3-oxoadipate enol-lactonase [Amycolatopsis sp. H20-H5]|uniref:3-oxoadipate enol-lactonase n=1 Tax=Amycolatopsis sp. H20-H5 TaxID=3046309 RepID=UPI002DBA47DE|nr:3-oxoadipate enol-lactonase [Amycolatopsis sp. H20-H5]MEC3976275.1 3-oxoadipate enol-lactonase [Amycolatopsis sp. H20-H5]